MTPEPLLFISKFSGSWAVARRNSLYQILAINAASGAWLRAKSTLSGAHLRTGVGQSGRDCYRELPRTPLLGTCVNKPPADVPEAAGWHHVHGVDPVEKSALARRGRKLRCQPKRRTKLSSAESLRRCGSSATWPPSTSSWLLTTWSIPFLLAYHLAPRA